MPQVDKFFIDGQDNFLGGMDSSRSPDVIADNAYALGVNIMARDSKLITRNGFRQLQLVDDGNDAVSKFQSGLFQGMKTYRAQETNGATSLFIAVNGWILKCNVDTKTLTVLNPTNQLSATAPKIYFCQAEKFMIIQDGLSTPLVYDGSGLSVLSGANKIPIGTTMAYGQGRLFVASRERTYITACDLAYGGSTTSFDITSSAAGASVSFTTAGNHGFTTGDVITITGHSSEPTVNGTWVITVTGATTFTIPRTTTVNGAGGRAIKASGGKVDDLLNNTETTYLNEGQFLQMPTNCGKIIGMVFQPVQATTTGQGDLIVFCEYGTVSFAVSQPRDQWKDIQFRRVTLDKVGAVSENSIVTMNGDIFFYSNDASLRSYRNALAEFNSYGQVPVGAEMNRIWEKNSSVSRPYISACRFNNRLFMTAIGNPSPITAGDTYLKPSVFQAVTSMDFNPVSASSYKNTPIFDGIWTGIDFAQIASDFFDGSERCFAVAFKKYETNTLYELTNADRDDSPTGASSPVQCILETKAFDFDAPYLEKKIYKLDTWWIDVEGQLDYTVHYKPDAYPCWLSWGGGTICSDVSTCEAEVDTTGDCVGGFASLPNLHPTYKNRVSLSIPDTICNPTSLTITRLGYEFQLRIAWTGRGRLNKILLWAQDAVQRVASRCET